MQIFGGKVAPNTLHTRSASEWLNVEIGTQGVLLCLYSALEQTCRLTESAELEWVHHGCKRTSPAYVYPRAFQECEQLRLQQSRHERSLAGDVDRLLGPRWEAGGTYDFFLPVTRALFQTPCCLESVMFPRRTTAQCGGPECERDQVRAQCTPRTIVRAASLPTGDSAARDRGR